MLRCLDAHPRIHVVHQIRQPEPPDNKSLFRLLREHKKTTISADVDRVKAVNVASDATILVKNATWKHPWKFKGFVLVRNPLSVVNSLSHRNPETARWAMRIDPSLQEVLPEKSQAEKVALVYEAKMLELATCGLPIVRYEDFVQHPEDVLRQLLALLKIPWHDSVLRSHELYPKGQTGHGKIQLWKPIHAGSLDSWKTLPAQEIESILRINAKSMDAFGYEIQDGKMTLRNNVPNLIYHGRKQTFFEKLKGIAKGRP